MRDCVVDASFLATANGNKQGVRPGNLLSKRLAVIRLVAEGQERLRVNPKLLSEYEPHVKECRNDLVELFVALLDTAPTQTLKSSTLRRADKVRANKCRWPTHDQHVLAAAVDGERVTIHVTENALGACGNAILREFGFHVNHIA